MKANPEKAADTYIRVNHAKIDRDLLVKIIKNPQVEYKIAPQNTLALAQFLHRVGAMPSDLNFPSFSFRLRRQT
ncbi:hypothetical protein ASC87_01870 [Rhizobacter sp. Root1221]|nr:hypothetical protein ASC87_01870 [Rhizobacter sp. Root1221]